MKFKNILVFIMLLISTTAFSQKPTIAVLNIDTKGIDIDSYSMGNLVRLELEKTDKFSVIDKYEVSDILKSNKTDISNCYSKTCLVHTGKLLNADKMLSGDVEKLGENIVITLRLVDIKSETIEKTDVTEYLDIPELERMVELSVRKILGLPNDPNIMNQLTTYDLPVQNAKNTLRLSGPRLGAFYTAGDAGEIITAPKSEGGFNMFPVSSTFGYQFEFQYISSGNFQALVENIILIGGMESYNFIPSYSPMLGFRFGKGDFEFAFGPTFRFVRLKDGFYGSDGKWYLTQQEFMDSTSAEYNPFFNPKWETRLDSRGPLSLSTGLVLAIGKTFHSGYLNIPFNVYVAPRKEGTTIGFAFGFNVPKEKKARKAHREYSSSDL